jgi:indole-3-glycerol phosphate synthase
LPETQGTSERVDILSRIVDTKWREVEALRPSARQVEAEALRAAPPRDFAGALTARGEVRLIAEVKRRSPGAGAIRPDLDPVELASGYAAAGAAAVSVLTDQDYFGGSLEDLRRVRAVVPIPALRKDFLVDPLQVFEARAAGADAILLIVRILTAPVLRELLELGSGLGMGVLVEVHDEPELERALAAGATIIGINNRDLRTFKTTLEVTERLLTALPGDRIVVSESGIRTREDVLRLGGSGVDAILVGESLLRAPDPTQAAALLTGCPSVPRGAPTSD